MIRGEGEKHTGLREIKEASKKHIRIFGGR